MEQPKKDEGLIKDSVELILKEFQTVVAFFYLILIGIGMLFNYYKYAGFGINIFQYADAFDFLIAPFQDIYIIIFSIVSILVPFGAGLLDAVVKKLMPRFYSWSTFGADKKSWYNIWRYFLFALVLVLYLKLAGEVYGDFYKENINEKATLSVIMLDKSVVKGKLIGKTQDMIFLLVGEKVTAIPVGSAVVKVEIE